MADCDATRGVQVRAEATSSYRAPGRPLSTFPKPASILARRGGGRALGGRYAEYSPRLAWVRIPRLSSPLSEEITCDDLPFALALALGAPACDDDSPTGPYARVPSYSPPSLEPRTRYQPISNAESNAQGTVTITFDVPRDANGAVTGNGAWTVQAASATSPTRAASRLRTSTMAPPASMPMSSSNRADARQRHRSAGRRRRHQLSTGPDHAVTGPGGDGQPCRQLLQHALAPQSGRSDTRAAHSGAIRCRQL